MYEQEFASPGDALEHAGVKGMKWGVRKKYSGSEIRDARARQNARAADVNAATNKLNLNSSGPGAKKAVQNYSKAVNAFNTSDDRAVAARMTKGEKAAAIILTGPIGLMIVGGNALAVKSIEKSNKK